MSSFGWIDASADDRRRVMEAIEKLKENDARDELGLAAIRDGFSNELFPGTGTLQTRAGYFLFVPWIYRLLHKRKSPSDQVEAAARKEEIKLISALMNSDDTSGVLGKVARERLKRLPSSVYWAGMRRWGIFQQDLGTEEYHRLFAEFRELDGARDDDGQLVQGRARSDWHPGLPLPPAGFPGEASFKLRAGDRAYLIERITLTVGSSLLAWLLRNGTTLDVEKPWEHPQAKDFPKRVQETLRQAQLFSDAMLGSAYLYNLMLAEELPESERRSELLAKYRNWLTQWHDELLASQAALSAWSLNDFWAFVAPFMRVSPGTRSFVESWVGLRGWLSPDGGADAKDARQLIRHRERQLKGPRARLGNPRALELWGTDSGTGRLVYRWPSAVRILEDLRPELATNAQS